MDSRVSLTPFFQYTQACPSHGRLTFVAIVNVKFPSASVSVNTSAPVSVKGGEGVSVGARYYSLVSC